MTTFEDIRLKFTSVEPLKYGANAAAEFDDPSWPRFVRITDVDANGQLRDDTFRSLPPEIAEPFRLQVGDILLARSGATVGKSFIFKESWGDACYAGYLIRLRTSDAYFSRYIYWCLQSSKYWADIDSNLIQSTIQNVSADRYASFRVPSPPLEAQQRIARFLDEKTTQIDGLIEKKRALLERLAEKRQALITSAVTKGLNPAAPMKPSGIDWLGDIPAHWGIEKLKLKTTKIGSGITPRGGASVYTDSGVMLLRSQNIHFSGLELSDVVFIDQETDSEMKNSRVQLSDVLLNITGASIGRCCVFDQEGRPANVNQHVCILRLDNRTSPYFVSLFLESSLGQSQIDMSQSRSGKLFILNRAFAA